MTKRAILPVRIDGNLKKMIENAAACLGISASAFMVHHAYQAAKEVLSVDHLVLSNEDWNLFTNAIEHPTEPNKALCELFNDSGEE